MRINVVPPIFKEQTYVSLKTDLRIEEINEDTVFLDENGNSWLLIDVELQNVLPFHLECRDYSGPVWVTENELRLIQLNEFEFTFESNKETELNIENYLFEPNIDKIIEISEFDNDCGFVPRYDVFGDYIGDGILQSRHKVTKALFRGFYEDLNENSLLCLSQSEVFSFNPKHRIEIQFKEIKSPISIFCYNAEILNSDGIQKVKSDRPWINPSIDITNYSPKDKFVIQCFEIIRLSHIPFDFVEFLKQMAFIIRDTVNISESNYQIYAVSLFYYLYLKFQDKKNETVYLNFLEFPIFYGFTKDEIFSKFLEIEKVYNGEKLLKIQELESEITNILVTKEEPLAIELSSFFDTYYGSKISKIMMEFLENENMKLIQLYVTGKLITSLSRPMSGSIPDLYEMHLSKIISENSDGLELFSVLRKLTIIKNDFLYHDVIWGPSLLFNLLSTVYYFKFRNYDSLHYLTLCYNHTKNRRDFVQFLMMNFYLGTKMGYVKSQIPIYQEYVNKFLKLGNESGLILGYLEYRFIVDQVISLKQIYNYDYSTEFKLIIQTILNNIEDDYLLIPTLRSEDVKMGLNLLDIDRPELNEKDKLKIINSRAIDVFIILLKSELYTEIPSLQRIIQFYQILLKLTNNVHWYSNIHKRVYDFSNERIDYYFTLLVLFNNEENQQQFELLSHQFSEEFLDKMDSEIYSDIMNAISSKENFENFIANENSHRVIGNKKSIFVYIKLDSLLKNYQKNRDKERFITSLIALSKEGNEFINYKPRYTVLKILINLIYNDPKYSTKQEEIIRQIKTIQLMYNIKNEDINELIMPWDKLEQYIREVALTIVINP